MPPQYTLPSWVNKQEWDTPNDALKTLFNFTF